VTDLPMSAAFSAAMLLWLRCGDRPGAGRILAGVLLGFAVLAKGLVPLALALPALWITRKHLWKSLIACVAVALPWYVLCTLRNGTAFLADFFWKHHFERFTSGALMHEQPWWYYVPILLAGLFPWTPLAALLFRRKLYSDPRHRFLLLWFAFGFVFFSVATNKLPGYLLPLVPALAALLGLSLAEVSWARWLLPCCALLLMLVPVVANVLPQVLSQGLGAVAGGIEGWTPWTAVALAVALLALRSREIATGLVVLGITAGVVFIKVQTYPVLDETVSARELWQRVSQSHGQVCVEDIPRNWRYGLNYYAIIPLPDCEKEPQWFHITPQMISQAESRSLPAAAAGSAKR
jgi:4-amino-4-deoxy-L-arabinose transferase-like glycosyltransferase